MASSQYSNDDSGYDGSQYGGHQPSSNTRSQTQPTQPGTPMNPPPPSTQSNNSAWATAPPPIESTTPSGGSFRYDGMPPNPSRHPLEADIPSTSMGKFEEALEKRRRILEVMPGSHVFHNCVAFHGGTQYNAPVITGGEEVGQLMSNILAGPASAFLDCYTEGSGTQYNGIWAEHDGNIEIKVPTDKGNYYDGFGTIPRVLRDEQVVTGKQINSLSIHNRKDRETEKENRETEKEDRETEKENRETKRENRETKRD